MKLPYSFVNENNLNYNSHVPGFNYFHSISKIEYLDYSTNFSNKNWFILCCFK